MVFTRKNLDWWCVRGILFLVLAMSIFAVLAFGAVNAWAFLVVQGMAAVVFVLWAVRLWLHRKPKLLWPPLGWAVVAFMAYSVARYFTADIEYVARQELIQVLLFGFLFLVVMNNLRGQEETEMVSFVLIALATLVAGYAVAQLMHHSNQVWNVVSPYAGRASGTFISPNSLAGFLALLLPLALAFLLVGKVGIVTRILLGYSVVALAAGLAVTFSRAGWVAAAAGILLVLGILLGHRNHRLKAFALVVALLVGGGFFTSHYLSQTVGYMRRVVKPDAEGSDVVETHSRLEMWQAAARMWGDYFWWGVGPAHYDYRFPEYRPEDLQRRPEQAHNDFLNLMADWGAVGGGIVFAGISIFIFGLVKTWPHVRRDENAFGTGQSNRFAFFLGAAGGLSALAVHSTMDFNLHIPANALIGVTLLGLVTSNLRFASECYWYRPNVAARQVLTVVLVGVAFYFAAQECRRLPETLWLARAERLPNFSPERAAALAKAYASEPKNFQTAYAAGECFRTQSLDGDIHYADLAQRAMDWYDRALCANPRDGYSFLRKGMCLDWLGRPTEADKWFSRAEACDPNGYYMVANLGWHYVQTGDYAAARQWFERSLKLDGYYNNTALNYLQICEPKLMEKASGRPLLPSLF